MNQAFWELLKLESSFKFELESQELPESPKEFPEPWAKT